MEPTGVGARDLAECLTLQLRTLPRGEAQAIAIIVCKSHLPLLARRDLKKLMAVTGADEDLLREAQALIVALEPKPGRPFARAEANIVVPDVIVQKSGRGWKVHAQPRRDAQAAHQRPLRATRSAAARPGGRGNALNGAAAGLNSRLQEARWFVKNILQRFDTIQRVSQAIVERQKSFFTHGAIAMKPLVLREIADELGLHESTISRVTTAKYMATPFGTFELKYFFGSSLATEAGGNASSTAVRALIRQIVVVRGPGQAALRQPDLADARGAGHPGRPAHRRQVPRSAEDRADAAAQGDVGGGTPSCASDAACRSFLPCAAGVEALLGPRCEALLPQAAVEARRGGVALAGDAARGDAAQPREPARAARADRGRRRRRTATRTTSTRSRAASTGATGSRRGRRCASTPRRSAAR